MFISSLLNYSYIAICFYMFVELFLYMFIANADIDSSVKAQNYYISEIKCKLNKKKFHVQFWDENPFSILWEVFHVLFFCVLEKSLISICNSGMLGIYFTIIGFHKKHTQTIANRNVKKK